jgi:hypothetical protein
LGKLRKRGIKKFRSFLIRPETTVDAFSSVEFSASEK